MDFGWTADHNAHRGMREMDLERLNRHRDADDAFQLFKFSSTGSADGLYNSSFFSFFSLLPPFLFPLLAWPQDSHIKTQYNVY
ncbi:hypothetical protein PHLCEN_2v8456 [Hermanssonia centrifuga]|uniref:Uncharacterized protein n=1 Tax=Hermanssonia centrifuga TaxID=98765 RepID=A0A2R6NTK5_9APHY|nr:hypothetical protein PHLCEN_2v8456 [Hermanssonia centrifuga]